jgi:hypothetical protein
MLLELSEVMLRGFDGEIDSIGRTATLSAPSFRSSVVVVVVGTVLWR